MRLFKIGDHVETANIPADNIEYDHGVVVAIDSHQILVCWWECSETYWENTSDLQFTD